MLDNTLPTRCRIERDRCLRFIHQAELNIGANTRKSEGKHAVRHALGYLRMALTEDPEFISREAQQIRAYKYINAAVMELRREFGKDEVQRVEE